MTTAYWWEGDERTGQIFNFGDQLAPLLLSVFAGIEVTWAPPEEADIVCCGSVLDVLPRSGWDGMVLGAGQLHADTITDLTFADVRAVRGAYTRLRIQCDLPYDRRGPIVGDPGLLASELVTPQPNRYEVGVVPHWTDDQLWPTEEARAEGHYEVVRIDATMAPASAIRAIGSCRKIVASSLHGIITADAFGIPRRAELPPSSTTDSVHEGDAFKWHDYASTLGYPKMQFGQLVTAPRVRVDQMQFDLFEMFRLLKESHG